MTESIPLLDRETVGVVVAFALVTAVWSLLFPLGTTVGLLFAGITVVYCFRRLVDR